MDYEDMDHRLQKSQAPELVQILRVGSPAVVAADDAPDQSGVLLDQPGTGVVVPPAGLLQQGGCIRYAHTGAPIRRETLRRRVTTVPLPGVERTFTASIKLSIMVKPMPLRSSVPVV